jgi:hypothetical protein
MKLSDARVSEFLWKSPLKSFPAMFDALRYLDGNLPGKNFQYEIFDDALGDNLEDKVKIRVPSIRGIAANPLLAFAWYAAAFDVVKRRPRTMHTSENEPEELIVFYGLTPSGEYMAKLPEALTNVTLSTEPVTQKRHC